VVKNRISSWFSTLSILFVRRRVAIHRDSTASSIGRLARLEFGLGTQYPGEIQGIGPRYTFFRCIDITEFFDLIFCSKIRKNTSLRLSNRRCVLVDEKLIRRNFFFSISTTSTNFFFKRTHSFLFSRSTRRCEFFSFPSTFDRSVLRDVNFTPRGSLFSPFTLFVLFGVTATFLFWRPVFLLPTLEWWGRSGCYRNWRNWSTSLFPTNALHFVIQTLPALQNDEIHSVDVAN